MGERNRNMERRFKSLTRTFVRHDEDFAGRVRECLPCGMMQQEPLPPQERRDWNRHLAMHEQTKTLDRPSWDAYIDKCMAEDTHEEG